MNRYCVVIDFWTEKNNGISYGGAAVRHIDENMRLHNHVLGCYLYDVDTNQTAPNIRAFVEQIS